MRGSPRPLDCVFSDPACAWLPGPVAAWLAPLAQRDYIYLYLVVVAVFLAFVYLALERIARSPSGRVLRAVRDEEASAAMNGKNVTASRVQSLVVVAFVMGIGGALYAHSVSEAEHTFEL